MLWCGGVQSAIKRKVVEEELGKILEMWVKEEPRCEWNSPIVLVQKREGELQFCVDFHCMNVV